jgi:site-specific DNA recombinase
MANGASDDLGVFRRSLFARFLVPYRAMSRAAVAYVRVSSREQELGFSLAAQRDYLETYARERGFEIVARFQESETAKTAGKRPEFAKMLAFLRVNAAVILVEKTDRLYRNLKDWMALDDLKAEIHFCKEGSVISADSHSSERFLHGIKVLMAKNYVENLSEEIRKGMRTKAEAGAFPSAAPLGYRNTADKTIGIEPDPATAAIVKELFEKASTGRHSGQELTRWARSRGLRSKKGHSLAKDTVVQQVLRNPAYHGTFRWGQKLHKGKFEPLISKATFERVQKVLDGRANTSKGRVRDFTYSGMIRCQFCGGLLSGSLVKGRYIYYSCTGKKGCRKFYPESLFEKETLKLLGALQIDESVASWITAEIEKMDEKSHPVDEKRLAALVSRRKQLKAMQLACYEDKLLGKIPESEWKERDTAWKEELKGVEAELAAIQDEPSKDEILAALRDPFELLQAAPSLYVSQEPAEKRRLLKTIASNLSVGDGSVSFQLRSPFDLLLKTIKTKDWWS